MNPKKPGTLGAHRIQLERQAIALTMCCPIERANPRACPLFALRPLAVRDRRVWVKHLALEELEYLVTYHACCAAEKKRRIAAKPKKLPAGTA